MALSKSQRRNKIKRRIRGKVTGTSTKPRLSVFRSNKQIYAQIIDDESNTTIVSVGSYEKGFSAGNKVDQAKLVGAKISEKALAAGVSSVVFDRNGYVYHGRVKALAESARENGLKF